MQWQTLSFCFVFDVSCSSHTSTCRCVSPAGATHGAIHDAHPQPPPDLPCWTPSKTASPTTTRDWRVRCTSIPVLFDIPRPSIIRPCESRASWGVWQWTILPPPSIRQLAAARKNSRSSLCRWSIFLVDAAVLAVSNQFQLSASKHQWRLSPFGAFFLHLCKYQ